MSDKKLKQVLVAHPKKFSSDTIKTFLKEDGVACYLLDELNDFSYLIEDLRPQALLIHDTLLKEHGDIVKQQLEDVENLSLIMIRSEGSSFESPLFKKIIQEPYSPIDLVQKIKSLLA